MRLLLLVILFFTLTCGACSRTINYSYEINVENAIKRGMSEFSGLHKSKVGFFILVRNNTTLLVCVMNSKLPPGLLLILQRTNRLVKIEHQSIPVIFESDLNSVEYKKGSNGNISPGGYLIQYNYKHEITFEGLLF